jgi:hypothetical protein
MKKEEAQVFAEYLSATANIYGRELTKEVIKIYLSVLKDYSFDAIKKAIERCILTKESFPVPAVIIKELTDKGDLLIRSELAWSYVLDVIDVCGIYKSFTFKDKAIRKAISLVDYDIELCMCNRAEIHWKKKDFIESYKVFAELNDNYDAPNYFAGIIEINNERWEDFKEKIYVAEIKQFVEQEDIIKIIDGYKPKLSLVDRKPKNQIARVKINA